VKRVNGCVYCHWSDVENIPADLLESGRTVLRDHGHTTDWNYVKWNEKTNTLTFAWCEGWVDRNEPIVRCQVMIRGDDVSIRSYTGDNPPIIHGKHMMIGPLYRGFSRRKAKQRWESYQGAEWLDKRRMGFLKWWEENAVPRIGR